MSSPAMSSSNCVNSLRPSLSLAVGSSVWNLPTPFLTWASKVTFLEGMPHILPNMDREISQNLKMILKKRGVDIVNNAMVQSVEETEEGLTVHFIQKDEEQVVTAQYVLRSVGRGPNTEGVFAEDATPNMERGRILVDEHFQSSIPACMPSATASSACN